MTETDKKKQPILIDGKATAASIKQELKKIVSDLLDAGKRAPHLAAVLVGDDGASKTYVASKEKQSTEVGFTSSVYRYPADISEQELLDVIHFLNNDEEIDGYIVQLPLPKHINERKILSAVSPSKDVDGAHAESIGKMLLGEPTFVPATPKGVMTLLERHDIATQGKNCVVIGRSNIVGTPMALLMSRNHRHANCTVTLCHSKTENLKEICLQADIIIVAIGKPCFLKADMVREGAVVIDVGIHRIPDDTKKNGYRLEGDVDYTNVAPKCSYITPVPGGVGPMTIVSLLQNTLQAYNNNHK